MTVRAATPSDAAAVAEIYIESSNAGFAGLLPARLLDAAHVARWRVTLADPGWWVAEREGSVVGFVGVGPDGELDTIAVVPAWWRRGVGRELHDVACEALRAAGHDEAFLWTLAGSARARAFYEALGWRADGGVRNDGTQVRYRRGLRSPHG